MVAKMSSKARCTTLLASCSASSVNTLRAKAVVSPSAKLLGTARTANVRCENGVMSP